MVDIHPNFFLLLIDGLSHPIGFYDFMAAEDSSEFMYLSDLDHVDEVLGNLTADSFRWKGIITEYS